MLAAHLKRHRIKHSLGSKLEETCNLSLSSKEGLTQHPGELLSEVQNPAAHMALLPSVPPQVLARQDTGRLGQGCTSMGNLSQPQSLPWSRFCNMKKPSRLATQQICPLLTKVNKFYLCQNTGRNRNLVQCSRKCQNQIFSCPAK